MYKKLIFNHLQEDPVNPKIQITRRRLNPKISTFTRHLLFATVSIPENYIAVSHIKNPCRDYNIMYSRQFFFIPNCNIAQNSILVKLFLSNLCPSIPFFSLLVFKYLEYTGYSIRLSTTYFSSAVIISD